MAINLDSGFEILYFSDLKYNEMTVEIQYKGQQVAQINKDKGVDKMEIDIYSESEFKFQISDFLEAINIASTALIDA
jgi:hypothetical protein